MSGEPVKIVSINEDHSYAFDEFALADILMDENVRNRNVAVISVAGAMRKGKSFILDFFLRYLNANYVKMDPTNWLGDQDTPLEGFSWRGGTDRNTSGILIWSEVFLYDSPSGDKIAIILMDTQGVFDNESTVKDNTAIFALSTMISTVQIYNIQCDIREDDLQHLQLFTEYGKLALKKTGSTPFQKLMFLIRDWSNEYEFEYGLSGGADFLEKKLKVSTNHAKELQSVRQHIRKCFENMECYLMPHPGFTATENPEFRGKLKDIRQVFVEHLKDLVPSILSPENLILKTMNGQLLKAREITHYFGTYVNYFNSDELLQPESLFATTANARNMQLVIKAVEVYSDLMKSLPEKINDMDEMNDFHNQFKNKAIDRFNSEVTIGGEEYAQKHREDLIEKINKIYVPIQDVAHKQLVEKGFIEPEELNIAEIIVRETFNFVSYPLIFASKLLDNYLPKMKYKVLSFAEWFRSLKRGLVQLSSGLTRSAIKNTPNNE